jgi:hypothetical protein
MPKLHGNKVNLRFGHVAVLVFQTHPIVIGLSTRPKHSKFVGLHGGMALLASWQYSGKLDPSFMDLTPVVQRNL